MPYPISSPRRPNPAEQLNLRHNFPQLNIADVWVIGDATRIYNCLAWSLGITYSWIWPWHGAVDKIQFDTLYRHHGYMKTSYGPSDIMVYGKSLYDMTHGAVYLHLRFNLGTTWTSKLGGSIKITHHNKGLQGPHSTYGNAVGYYRNSSPIASSEDDDDGKEMEKTTSFEDIGINPISELEIKLIDEHVSKTDDKLKESFTELYSKWEQTWNDPEIIFSDNPATRAESKEFYDLISLGPEITPLIINKLRDHNQFFALQALEIVAPSSIIFRPQIDDIAVLGGEQLRARETILRWSMIAK